MLLTTLLALLVVLPFATLASEPAAWFLEPSRDPSHRAPPLNCSAGLTLQNHEVDLYRCDFQRLYEYIDTLQQLPCDRIRRGFTSAGNGAGTGAVIHVLSNALLRATLHDGTYLSNQGKVGGAAAGGCMGYDILVCNTRSRRSPARGRSSLEQTLTSSNAHRACFAVH